MELGRWVAATLPKDEVIAVNDAGALRYFGNRTTIDLLGLNNHRLLHRDPALGESPLQALGVRYLIVFPEIYKAWVEGLHGTPVHDARSPHYTICRAPQDHMVVYRVAGPGESTTPSGSLRAENADSGDARRGPRAMSYLPDARPVKRAPICRGAAEAGASS